MPAPQRCVGGGWVGDSGGELVLVWVRWWWWWEGCVCGGGLLCDGGGDPQAASPAASNPECIWVAHVPASAPASGGRAQARAPRYRPCKATSPCRVII